MASPNTAIAAAAPSEPQAKIVLHWLEKSRSQRIIWLLEELKLTYELKIYHRQSDMLAPPELKKVHPLGKSPVLTITPPGTETPIVLAESGLIVEYLSEHYGQNTTLIPRRYRDGMEGKVGGETEEWLRYKYYLHFVEGSFMTPVIVNLVATVIKRSAPFYVSPVTNGVSSRIMSSYVEPNHIKHLTLLEEQLKTSCPADSKTRYICGPRLTGADILLSFPLIAGKGRIDSLTEENFPLLWKYILRLENEPGYLKAVDKIVEIDGSFTASL